MRFYGRLFNAKDETEQIRVAAEAAAHYESLLPSAFAELAPPTGRIDRAQSRLPGVTAETYARFQDLENILTHVLNLEEKALLKKSRFYKEGYQRDLSDRMAEKYAETDDSVQDLRQLRFYVSSVRNQYLAITKGLEVMHFQITNLTKLRTAGLDDATF